MNRTGRQFDLARPHAKASNILREVIGPAVRQNDPSEGSRPGAWFAIGLIVLIALAAFSRWPLVREGLWRDEALTVYIARSPSLDVLLKRNQISDHNPPLFNVLVAGWGAVFGFEERSLKVFALGSGLSAILGVAFLANMLFGRSAGLLSAFLATNNPILIGLSAELRSYSLSVLLATISLALVLRLRSDSSGRAGFGRSILLALLLSALVYSHVAGALVALTVGMTGIGLWLRGRMQELGKALTLSAAVAGASGLLWAPTFWLQSRTGLPWEAPLSLTTRWRLLEDRLADVLPCARWMALVVLTALFLLVAFSRRETVERLRRLSFGAGLIGAAGLLVLLAVPAAGRLGLYSRGTRYLAVPAALLAVLVGGILAAIWESARAKGRLATFGVAAGILSFLTAVLLSALPGYREIFARDRLDLPKSGIRSLCRDHPSDRGLVLVAPDYLGPTVWYYCGSSVELRGFVRWRDPALFDPRRYAELWPDPASVPRTLTELAHFLGSEPRKRFELVWDSSSDSAPLFYSRRVNDLRRALSDHYARSETLVYPGRLERVSSTEYRQ